MPAWRLPMSSVETCEAWTLSSSILYSKPWRELSFHTFANIKIKEPNATFNQHVSIAMMHWEQFIKHTF